MKAKKSVIALSCSLFLFAAVAIGGVLTATDHNHDALSNVVIDHSGRTDKCGGHYNRKTGLYHYHSTPRC